MATLHGQIRRAGQGVPGLRVVGYEEIQIGYEVDDTPPCQLGPPSVEYIGDDLTDDTGRFRIEYTPREDPDECGFRAVVRVRVFEGATALWQSPNKIAAASVRFDFDIPAPPPPLDPEGEARVFGVLTRCGQPATGYRIVAFEEVRHGYPYLHHPCVEASPVVRNLGTVVVAPDGSFEIDTHPPSLTRAPVRSPDGAGAGVRRHHTSLAQRSASVPESTQVRSRALPRLPERQHDGPGSRRAGQAA